MNVHSISRIASSGGGVNPEIAFFWAGDLFEDPNSFFRAFHAWTGATPDAVRRQAMH